MRPLFRWLYDKAGATALEYSMIAGGIALAIVTALFLVGGDLESLFNFMASSLGSAAGKI